jgi:hypothetical protein
MNFDRHLFISYAHLDNQPLTPQEQGWITRFHASLSAVLSMRMGRKAEIWRDSKLSGSDTLTPEIVRQLSGTALLVSVLTPRYLESEWCTREVLEFCNTAEKAGGLVVDNKSRVLKIIKTPVDSEAHLPTVMKDVLGYPFYALDDDQTPIELDPAYGPDFAQKYNLKVAKLAWDIAQLIRKLEATGLVPPPPPDLAPTKPSVYLAECSYDRREAREALEAELRFHGYPILPERQLPRDEGDYAAEVARLLEQCKLSIHLVGSVYQAEPDGPSQKFVVLQNELAIQRSKIGGLQRVIWLPEETTSKHPEQGRFIDALRNDAEAQFGADLITTDLETLKRAVHATLRKLQSPESNAPHAAKFVYLICDERDRSATISLRRFLRAQGLEVQIPVFEGDAATVRRANQLALTQSHAVMVFYGTGDEAWKRTVENDLKKINGYRREKTPASNYTYLAEPSTADKRELIELGEPNLVNGLGGFSESEIKPFLQALQAVML